MGTLGMCVWSQLTLMRVLSHVQLFVTPRTIAWQSPFGISKARKLKWAVISFSRGSSQPRDQTHPLHWQVDSLPLCHLGKPYDKEFSSVQFISVAQSCPTLCDHMNRSTPGLPVHHHLPEFTQTHIHRVSDAIQPSHPLLSPSSPAPNPSQHQGLFQ